MDTPNIVAANWFRAAYEQIVTRELARSNPTIPVAAFQTYVRDLEATGSGAAACARSLGPDRSVLQAGILPTLLDDPEFRDDAVSPWS